MQTILGAGGAIGNELAKALYDYTPAVRLVGRKPQQVTGDEILFPADLTRPDEVFQAVEGSEVVYLCVGLKYSYKVWHKSWPPLMLSVIEACKEHQCKLVFFDNVYLYAPSCIPHMTENCAVSPSSRKGQVRRQLVEMIWKEVKLGKLEALIARSADFYGPGIHNSLLLEMVHKNLAKGKKANWFAGTGYTHSFTYTPDAAKATALLVLPALNIGI